MPRGAVRAVVLSLVLVLAVGCTRAPDRATADPAGPPERTYWPTDGWRTADPADHGLDEDELAEVERLVAQSFTSVRSILIVRDGYLVYERYWQGFDADDGHDVRSVTKSVVSALVGIAMAEGSIDSLDQTVGELFADKLPGSFDPRMADVTVLHLLSMTSGLPGDDPSLGGDQTVIEGIDRSPDAVRAILGLPLTADPGTAFAYSSLSSDLLSAVVTDATEHSTLEFARERLFDPIGIDTSHAYAPVARGPPTPEQIGEYERASVAWPADPQGYHFGGGGLKLPSRDLARFGFLYLNEGRWDGEQIVPADYVRASTSPDVSTPDPSMDYGWQWWVPRDNDHGSFVARGRGGQIIYIDPALDLVAVVTCDPETSRGDPAELVEFAILPAAEK